MAKKTKPTRKARKRAAEKKGVQQEIDLRLLPGDARDVLMLMNNGRFDLQGNMTERFSVLKAKLANFAQGAPPEPKPDPKPEADDKEKEK